MLSKAPLNLSESIKFSGNNFRISAQFGGIHFRGTCETQWRKPRVSVKAGGGFTRKPLETEGAYELIDEETGEKYIVWGGADDDDSPIPPKEVLTWKPNRKSKPNRKESITSNGVEPASSFLDSDESTGLHRDIARSFSKLKTHKIRALSRKVSHVQKGENGNEVSHLIDDHFHESDKLDTEPQLTVKSTIMDSLRHKHKGLLRASEPQHNRDKTGVIDSKLGLTDSTRKQNLVLDKTFPEPYEHSLETDKEDVSVPRAAAGASLREDVSVPKAVVGASLREDVSVPKAVVGASLREDVSVPRAAIGASLREWDAGVRTQNSRYDSKDNIRQHRKISSDSGFFSQTSFRDLGCSEDIIESLKGQLFFRPSHIQSMAFASALEGKSCIVADQSGSGKTLAYLAPVIQRLRHEELQGLGKSSAGSPRVVILVPTAELGSQVLRNCRSMSKFGVPFRSMVATGGFRQKTQLESLQQDVDVLIATPGRFMFLLKEGFLQLANLKCAVLDEVDILYGDEDFEQVLQILLNSAPVATQYLFVTATLPVDIYNKLVEVFPDCEVILGPGMHRTSSGLEEVLIDCSGDDRSEKTPETAFLNKKSALLQLVDERPVSKTIIFCNKIETCRKVENILKRVDRKEARIRVLPFHSALAQEARLQNIKEFLNSQTKEDSLFLICTDRASRGIDFAGVDHVVLFDYPRDPSEYVRRVGRTARGAGGKGKAFVFVVGKQVSLARRIIERNKKGHLIHDVPSAYELVR